MKVSKSMERGFGFSAAIVLLAGCSGGSQLVGSMPGVQTQALRSGLSANLGHTRSWMSPDAKTKNLLYVSLGTEAGEDEILVWSYPKGKFEGVITGGGLNDPLGMCVDKSGDVFVANHYGADVLEYAHGGTLPIATLSDSGEFPQGCSVDPTTGNLAVTSYYGPYGSYPGDVAIYQNAQGMPTTYSAPSFFLYDYCGYDDAGNLYVDGNTGGGGAPDFLFAEMPAGSSGFTDISLPQSIYIPNGVQWDGQHVAVGDETAGGTPISAIYRFTITNGNATEVGTTKLDRQGGGSAPTSVTSVWIDGKRVVGANGASASGDNNPGLWKYPAGGAAIHIFPFGPSGGYQGEGVTISKAS
jgi:hypothetical protein